MLIQSIKLMSLGNIIKKLEKVNQDAELTVSHAFGKGFYASEFCSYRHSYASLAIIPSNTPITIKEFLTECNEYINGIKKLEHTKGGYSTIRRGKPLWIVIDYNTASAMCVTKIEVTKYDTVVLLIDCIHDDYGNAL